MPADGRGEEKRGRFLRNGISTEPGAAIEGKNWVARSEYFPPIIYRAGAGNIRLVGGSFYPLAVNEILNFQRAVGRTFEHLAAREIRRGKLRRRMTSAPRQENGDTAATCDA
jgi:hypothetical protein